ncbi:uncharacterized protein [Aegilops tauschii subsp. strangulata]|uniref:uncharacterized protein isoform X2 n=1 Tax=Aegilops tauschii subsp. strangulata TaxID=200361 RepID=UPI001E1CAD70|nr:uncharacterized protein LOC120974181 isoform X2 [Aegilops tauschii subsp. strangulata]
MDSSKVETAEKPSGSVDHPCVERLRHRRLLAFLRDQGFHGAYAEVTRKTGVHMSLRHLRGLVERGRWADAIAYLELHLPPPPRPRSSNADLLHAFLVTHRRFADAVAGHVDPSALPGSYFELCHSGDVGHGELRLRSITFLVLGFPHIRADMDWESVRSKASFVVWRLATATLELQGRISLPTAAPHQLLPVAPPGLSRGRGHVKNKKQEGSRPRPKAIIRAMKSHLIAPADKDKVSDEKARESLADILDETLKAGIIPMARYPVGNQGVSGATPLQLQKVLSVLGISPAEINPDAPGCQHISATLTAAKMLGASSPANAAGAPTCQPISAILEGAKMFGTSSLTSAAGAPPGQPISATPKEVKMSGASSPTNAAGFSLVENVTYD